VRTRTRLPGFHLVPTWCGPGEVFFRTLLAPRAAPGRDYQGFGLCLGDELQGLRGYGFYTDGECLNFRFGVCGCSRGWPWAGQALDAALMPMRNQDAPKTVNSVLVLWQAPIPCGSRSLSCEAG